MVAMYSASEDASTPSFLPFNQHLGYVLRESWISKALLALLDAERQEGSRPNTLAQVFALPQVSDHFGISPAAVPTLRFWLRATGIMVEERQQRARRVPTLTAWGRVLALHDPYLTRAGSIWMLHAHLARNLEEAPAFAWFFQHFAQREMTFTKEACAARLHTWAIAQAPTQEIRPRTLGNDLACLFQMYLPAPARSPEQEVLASPFRRLGLLSSQSGRGGRPTTYQCHAGRPPALVTLATLLLQQERKPQLLRDLVHRPGSVGRTYGLSAVALVDLLSSIRLLVPAWMPEFERVEHLEWVTPPASVIPEEVMTHYYRIVDRG